MTTKLRPYQQEAVDYALRAPALLISETKTPPIPWTRKDNRLYAADGEEIVVATNASPKYRKASVETAEAIRVRVNSHDALVAALQSIENRARTAITKSKDVREEFAQIADLAQRVRMDALKLAGPTIWHSVGRPCGATANEAEGITEIPEHVNCPVCLARLVESEGA